MPGMDGLASMSNFSESNHAGAPMTCLGWRSYANLIRSARVVLWVFILPLRFTTSAQPGCLGSDGLMVATSNSGLAFGSIILGGGGGSGIDQAVCGVARARFRGT